MQMPVILGDGIPANYKLDVNLCCFSYKSKTHILLRNSGVKWAPDGPKTLSSCFRNHALVNLTRGKQLVKKALSSGKTLQGGSVMYIVWSDFS